MFRDPPLSEGTLIPLFPNSARRTEAENRRLLREVNKDLGLLVNLFYTTWHDAVPPSSTEGKIKSSRPLV